MNDGPDDILNLRRSLRYTVDRPEAVRVQLRYRLQETVEVLPAELADISRYGMKLKTSMALAIKEAVQVQLSLPEGAVDVSLDGKVCWARLKDEKHWWLGISLTVAISPAVLDQLAAEEVIDRRRDRRLTVAADARARFELESDSFAVKVLDLSQGGFSILAPYAGHVGDRMLLVVNPAQLSTPPVLGRICWTRDEGEHHVYGCEFITSSAAATVRAGLAQALLLANGSGPRLVGPTASAARSSLPWLTGIACIALVFCLHSNDGARLAAPRQPGLTMGPWQPPSDPSGQPERILDTTDPMIRVATGSERGESPVADTPASGAEPEHPLIPIIQRGFQLLQAWWK